MTAILRLRDRNVYGSLRSERKRGDKHHRGSKNRKERKINRALFQFKFLQARGEDVLPGGSTGWGRRKNTSRNIARKGVSWHIGGKGSVREQLTNKKP